MVMCAAPAAPPGGAGPEAAVAAGAGVLWVVGALLAVCLDEALDELVDVARLGQVPLGQQVAQLGLGQAFVARAGPCVSLPGVLALGLAGLACQLLLGLVGLRGLLAGGPLGLLSLLALGLAGLACQLLFGLLGLRGLLAGGPLGVLSLLARDVTGGLGLFPHDVTGRFGLLADRAGQRARRLRPPDGKAAVDL